MFLSHKKPGVSAFHFGFQVEVVGNLAEVKAVMATLAEQPGVGKVESYDVENERNWEYRDGPYRGRHYYVIDIMLDDRQQIEPMIEFLEEMSAPVRHSLLG